MLNFNLGEFPKSAVRSCWCSKMCFVAALGGGPALAPRSDIAVCGVGIFGAGGCSCGCASRPEENEENITFYLKRKGLLKDCKTLCFGKISLFENSMGAREGRSLGASGPVLFWCTHGADPPSPSGHPDSTGDACYSLAAALAASLCVGCGSLNASLLQGLLASPLFFF